MVREERPLPAPHTIDIRPPIGPLPPHTIRIQPPTFGGPVAEDTEGFLLNSPNQTWVKCPNRKRETSERILAIPVALFGPQTGITIRVVYCDYCKQLYRAP